MIPIIAAGVLAIAFITMKKASANENIGADIEETENPNTPFFKFDVLFKKYAQIYSVDWQMLKAICMNESSLGQNKLVKAGLVSSDGLSYGIMQMTLTTAKDYETTTTPTKLNDPEFSIKVASQHLKMLKLIFNKSGTTQERDIVMSYNHGQGNQKKLLKYETEKKSHEGLWKAGKEYWARYQRNKDQILEKGI